MGLRDRHDQRRGERRGTTTYRMRQRLVSIGDDFWIEDQAGNRAYKVDGKALRIRRTMILEDAKLPKDAILAALEDPESVKATITIGY